MAIIIRVIFILISIYFRVLSNGKLHFNLRHLKRHMRLLFKFFLLLIMSLISVELFKSHSGHRDSRALRAGARFILMYITFWVELYSEQVLSKFGQSSGIWI